MVGVDCRDGESLVRENMSMNQIEMPMEDSDLEGENLNLINFDKLSE